VLEVTVGLGVKVLGPALGAALGALGERELELASWLGEH
jgi:hypothetical protein